MSWLDTNIITAAQVRDHTGKAKGVEDRKLDPPIHFAQHALEEVLGVTLYALLETAYEANPTTLGGADMLALYGQHCVPFLAWKTMEQAYPDLHSEADRNGVFNKSGNDYTTVSGSVLATLTRVAGSRAEVHQKAMLTYLRNLDTTNAIRIAFDTCVAGEARTTSTTMGGITPVRNPWQDHFDGQSYARHNGCHDES